MQKLNVSLYSVKTLLIVLAASLFFYGCIKKDTVNCREIRSPQASSNAPVVYGSVIRLQAHSSGSSVSYHWSGPYYFSTEVQNPEIYNASQLTSGIYALTVSTDDGCVSDTVFTNVTISFPSAPCNPINNQYTLDGLTDVPLSYVTFQAGSSDYEITGNGSNGDIHFYFSTLSKPKPGIYKVSESYYNADNVRVK